MIAEEAKARRIGNLYGENRGTGFAGNVWDKDGICPAITTMQGGGRQPMIIEKNKYCVAMRERNPDNLSDKTRGARMEQRLEPNSQDVVNALTTVQKDNMVFEENTVVDMYNKRKINGDIYNTITANGNTSSTHCGTFGIIKKVGQISSDGSQCGTVMSEEGLSPTLTARTHGYANPRVATSYRIRKLTPRECYRLMGFSDEDFDRAASVLSNTQLYKTAGNAIIKQVLMAIFSQLGIKGVKKWNDMTAEERRALVNGSMGAIK